MIILAVLGASAGFGLTVSWLVSRRVRRTRFHRLFQAGPDATARLRLRLGAGRMSAVLPRRYGHLLVAGTAVLGAVVGAIVAGPVAAVVLAAYAVTGLLLYARARQRRAEARSRRQAVDAVAGLAAQLRAGLAVAAVLADASQLLSPAKLIGEPAAVVARQVSTAIAVADTGGAPLAEVFDRLDIDLRASDRALAAAAAQAAGARATAALLAGMPVAGVGLGYLVGVDPMQVLLHTPLGAACLIGAVALQLAGVAWSVRLTAVVAS